MYGGKKDKRFHGSRQVYYGNIGEAVASGAADAAAESDSNWISTASGFVQEHGQELWDAVQSIDWGKKKKPKKSSAKPKTSSKPKRSSSSGRDPKMRWIKGPTITKRPTRSPYIGRPRMSVVRPKIQPTIPTAVVPASIQLPKPPPVEEKSNTALWIGGAVTLTALLGGGAWWWKNRQGGANEGLSVSFFPRGGNEWNFILSDGSMGVVEVDVIIDSLVRDTGMNPETIHSMVNSGASIVIPQSLFSSLKNWGNRPYMGM